MIPGDEETDSPESQALLSNSVNVTMVTMEEEWLVVAGAPTFVVKLGNKPQPGQPLFLIIPGNIGLPKYIRWKI